VAGSPIVGRCRNVRESLQPQACPEKKARSKYQAKKGGVSKVGHPKKTVLLNGGEKVYHQKERGKGTLMSSRKGNPSGRKAGWCLETEQKKPIHHPSGGKPTRDRKGSCESQSCLSVRTSI